MKEYLYRLLEELIIQHNIRINQAELKLQLLSHPSYPSLHSLTGVLNHLNINNLALRVPTDHETLSQLPTCFIANIKDTSGTRLVLAEKKDKQIRLTYGGDSNNTIPTEDFLTQWDGIILAIEKDDHIEETDIPVQASTMNWILSILGILTVGYFVFSYANLFTGLHFLLSLVGLSFSVLIVQHELGKLSVITNRFCNLSKTTSCEAVLNSNGATLFNRFKLSDISLVTFGTFSIYWVFVFINGGPNNTLISLLNFAAIPIVLYSIYYQHKVVKKWCPLCLGIGAVLLLQAVVLVFSHAVSTNLSTNLLTGVLFMLAFSVTLLSWRFVKPLFETRKAFEKLNIQHHKFKRNFSVFQTFWGREEPLLHSSTIPGEIVLGNKQALVQIVLVTNPLCFYCKKAHRAIEHLLNFFSDKIKVTIRFNVDATDNESVTYQIVAHLLDAYATKSNMACQELLDEVYLENFDHQQWLQNQKTPIQSSYNSIIEQQRQWCINNQVNFTPAFYVNNFSFPTEYEFTDLAYFIDDIIELQEVKAKQVVQNILLPMTKEPFREG